eukprot:g1289.t1
MYAQIFTSRLCRSSPPSSAQTPPPAAPRSFVTTYWLPFLKIVRFLVREKVRHLTEVFYTTQEQNKHKDEEGSGSSASMPSGNVEMTEGMRALHRSSFVGEAVVPKEAHALYKVMNYEQAEGFAFHEETKRFFAERSGCVSTADFLVLYQLLLEYCAAHAGQENALQDGDRGAELDEEVELDTIALLEAELAAADDDNDIIRSGATRTSNLQLPSFGLRYFMAGPVQLLEVITAKPTTLRGMYLGLTGRFMQRQTRQIRVYFPMSFGNWFDHAFGVSLVQQLNPDGDGAEDTLQVSGVLLDDKQTREGAIRDRIKTDNSMPGGVARRKRLELAGSRATDGLPPGFTADHLQYYYRVPVLVSAQEGPHEREGEQEPPASHFSYARLFQNWHPIAQVTLFYWFLKHCLAVLEKDVQLPMGTFSQTYARLEDWANSGVNYEKLSQVLEQGEMELWRSIYPSNVNASPFGLMRLMGDRKIKGRINPFAWALVWGWAPCISCEMPPKMGFSPLFSNKKFLDIWRFLAKFGKTDFVWGRYLNNERGRDISAAQASSAAPSPGDVEAEADSGVSASVAASIQQSRLLASEASSVKLQRAWWPQATADICEFLFDTATALVAEIMFGIHDSDSFQQAYDQIQLRPPVRIENEMENHQKVGVFSNPDDSVSEAQTRLQAAFYATLEKLGIDSRAFRQQKENVAEFDDQKIEEHEQGQFEFVAVFDSGSAESTSDEAAPPFVSPLFEYVLNSEIEHERLGKPKLSVATCGEAIGQMVETDGAEVGGEGEMGTSLEPLQRFRLSMQRRLDRVALADTLYRWWRTESESNRAETEFAASLFTSKNPTNLWDDCDPAQSLTRKFLNYAQDQMDSVLSRVFQVLDENVNIGVGAVVDGAAALAAAAGDGTMKPLNKGRRRFYVDVGIGFAGVEHYTRFLRTFLPHKWEGLMLDVGHSNPAINYQAEMLMPSNVVSQVFPQWQVPRDFDFLVLQIDSYSWHVLRKILLSSQSVRRARVRKEIAKRVGMVLEAVVGAGGGASCSRGRSSSSAAAAVATGGRDQGRNVDDVEKEQSFYYPKVIQIEHIHSYFWPDHMIPIGLNLIPRFHDPLQANAGRRFRERLDEVRTARRSRRRNHKALVEVENTLAESERDGDHEHEDVDEDTTSREPLSLSFTLANDYEARVAAQIQGYFKAYIATATAVKQLANAFGYDVVYFGWWNMLIVDRLLTSRVEPDNFGMTSEARAKLVADLADELVQSSPDPLNTFDPEKVAKKLGDRLGLASTRVDGGTKLPGAVGMAHATATAPCSPSPGQWACRAGVLVGAETGIGEARGEGALAIACLGCCFNLMEAARTAAKRCAAALLSKRFRFAFVRPGAAPRRNRRKQKAVKASLRPVACATPFALC